MILNLSKIKTEALLLFCKDLIQAYEQSGSNFFNIEDEIINFVDIEIKKVLDQINNTTKRKEYYLSKQTNFHIRAVLKSYDQLNSQISKNFSTNEPFNPSMLCFALLSTWFAELEKERKSPEYLYFSLYSYSIIYDKLMIEANNSQFKLINIKMLNIAESSIKQYDNFIPN
jgi:hypothetical protein